MCYSIPESAFNDEKLTEMMPLIVVETLNMARYVTHSSNMQSQDIFKTRNAFCGRSYLSHCSARFAFNPLFVNWVTSLTPRVTWRHLSRDHWNHSWSFPIGDLLMQGD